MKTRKEVLDQYPELKRPAPRYWLAPATLIALVFLVWACFNTELIVISRDTHKRLNIRTPFAEFQESDQGRLEMKSPVNQWRATLNILFGVAPSSIRDQYGDFPPIGLRQGGLIRPNLGRETIKLLLPDIGETITMALLGTLMAFILAFPLAFLAARNIVGSSPPAVIVYGVVRFIFNFLSAIPALIVALIFTVIVGMGPSAGALALGLNSIGMLGRLFAEALEGVDRGPIEALQAVGAGRIQTVVYGVLPQIGPLFLSYSIYRWDINVRMSMILGFVGAGGIGVYLQQNINMFHYSEVSTAFILILITVTLLDWGNSWIQRRVL
jgi:phosphonate ABC transporter permease subunit PhnE